MEIVGKCQKCGREFLAMPSDAVDHYFPVNVYLSRKCLPTAVQCGGRVLPVEPIANASV